MFKCFYSILKICNFRSIVHFLKRILQVVDNGETGDKGEKGDMGPPGMPGTKGEPGESISTPAVVVSPVTLTVNEGGTATFQCSASGNPEPAVSWSKLNSQSEVTQSAVSGGKLELKKVTGSDSGVYQCSATNILGNSREVAQLVVNGEFLVISIIAKILSSKISGYTMQAFANNLCRSAPEARKAHI